jgi:hypothetical protein
MIKSWKLILFLSLAVVSYGERRSEWKAASDDHEIEFQWIRPANNDCEVSLRDLLLKNKTSLTATIQYLPHRLSKQSVEKSTAKLVIGVAGSASEHVNGCEEIVGVSVTGVMRE